MAFTDTPTLMIPNYTYAGDAMVMPIASFPELTAGECSATTGDSRKMVMGLMECFYQWYNALATADKPAEMTLVKSVSTNTITGAIAVAYNVAFIAEAVAGGIEVQDEPA